jgi:hypothetical protein
MRRTLLFASLFVAAIPAAGAADWCVASATALYGALNTAALSPEADDIRLVKGTISVTFEMDPGVRVEGDLEIRGGFDAGCATRANAAAQTRLEGPGRRLRLVIDDIDILLERVVFSGFAEASIGDNVAGSGVPGNRIVVRRTGFLDGSQGLRIGVLRHDVRVESSLFARNAGTGLRIEQIDSDAAPHPFAEVVFATVVDNGDGIAVFGFSPQGMQPLYVSNTISYGNTGDDYRLEGPVQLSHGIHRNIAVLANGTVDPRSRANLASDPRLDAKYRPLVPFSPAINSGDNAALGFGFNARDYAGNARKIGSTVDRGAFESSVEQ